MLAGLKGRLAIGQVALGGHSFGGCTALMLACEMMLAARRDSSDAPPALPAGKVTEAQYKDVALGAVFSLDPALDWLPRSIQPAMGHEAPAVPTPATNNGKCTPPIPRAAPSPVLSASGVPLFTVWSEEWAQRGWYKQWTANLTERAKHPASHALVVQGYPKPKPKPKPKPNRNPKSNPKPNPNPNRKPNQAAVTRGCATWRRCCRTGSTCSCATHSAARRASWPAASTAPRSPSCATRACSRARLST